MRENGLSREEGYDRATWSRISSNIDPTYKREYDEKEEQVTKIHLSKSKQYYQLES